MKQRKKVPLSLSKKKKEGKNTETDKFRNCWVNNLSKSSGSVIPVVHFVGEDWIGP